MKIKCLSVEVFKNPLYRDCANGGISARYDELYAVCEDGCDEIDEDDPRLIKFVKGAFESVHAEPYKPVPPNRLGWMMGGSFVGSSDARITKEIKKVSGIDFYGAVALHDRCETQEEYDLLSD